MGATGQRMAGLVARVFNPKRAGKYADATQFIAGWESAVRHFERGAETTLIDNLKIFGLKQVVPGELEKDMNRQNSLLLPHLLLFRFTVLHAFASMQIMLPES